MKKAKVRVVANYISRDSYHNSVDRILNLPIDFTEIDIINKIYALQYNDGYNFKSIEVLCIYDEDECNKATAPNPMITDANIVSKEALGYALTIPLSDTGMYLRGELEGEAIDAFEAGFAFAYKLMYWSGETKDE